MLKNTTQEAHMGPNQYLDFRGHIRTRAIRHSIAARKTAQAIIDSTDPRDQAFVKLCKQLERKLHGTVSADYER